MEWKIYGAAHASVLMGTVEADTKEEATAKADADIELNWMPSLCHYCTNTVEVNEVYKIEAVEATT